MKMPTLYYGYLRMLPCRYIMIYNYSDIQLCVLSVCIIIVMAVGIATDTVTCMLIVFERARPNGYS